MTSENAKPSVNKKQKTVNTGVVVSYNGKRDTLLKQDVSYSRLVAVQAALSSVLVQLASVGASRIADAVEGLPDQGPGGNERLNLAFITNHGNGGTSSVVVDYTGISEAQAQQIIAMFKTTLGAATATITVEPVPAGE